MDEKVFKQFGECLVTLHTVNTLLPVQTVLGTVMLDSVQPNIKHPMGYTDLIKLKSNANIPSKWRLKPPNDSLLVFAL